MYFIDIHTTHSEIFEKHIQKYSFRKNISLNNLTEALEVHATYSEIMIPETPEGSSERWYDTDEPLITANEEGSIHLHGYTAFIDPRTKILGSRTIIAGAALEIDPEIMQKPVEFYNNFRRLCGVCEGRGATGQIPHMLNFQLLHAICFNKGCYVGQELVARTQSQGTVRTHSLPFVVSDTMQKFDESMHVPITVVDESFGRSIENEKIYDSEKNVIGQVIEADKNIGIAKVRVEGSEGLCQLSDGSKLFFWKPLWLSSLGEKQT